jgi:hypothetical protein
MAATSSSTWPQTSTSSKLDHVIIKYIQYAFSLYDLDQKFCRLDVAIYNFTFGSLAEK